MLLERLNNCLPPCSVRVGMPEADQHLQRSGHLPALSKGAIERRALRTIASIEAVKGVVAIAAGLGLLSLVNRDLHHMAAALIGHVGLDPGASYPAMILHDIDVLHDARPRTILLAAGGYAAVRFAEAYGLWNVRRWGEWLGAVSGAVYVPFELQHWMHRPSAFATTVIVVNIAVVVFLFWQLWRASVGAVPGASALERSARIRSAIG
ncbi:MAG: DUF2127 domain-containing protein [Burkholderiaceae bacterium]